MIELKLKTMQKKFLKRSLTLDILGRYFLEYLGYPDPRSKTNTAIQLNRFIKELLGGIVSTNNIFSVLVMLFSTTRVEIAINLNKNRYKTRDILEYHNWVINNNQFLRARECLISSLSVRLLKF